jgi:hypothetical protein
MRSVTAMEMARRYWTMGMSAMNGQPDFRDVVGISFRIPADQPNILVLELRTPQGPFRFGLTKDLALGLAAAIAENAELLKAERSEQ